MCESAQSLWMFTHTNEEKNDWNSTSDLYIGTIARNHANDHSTTHSLFYESFIIIPRSIDMTVVSPSKIEWNQIPFEGSAGILFIPCG